MLRLTLILLIVSFTTQAQQISFEQNAFDYFFNNIFMENYPKVKSIQFSGSTERTLTEFDILKNCFQEDDQIRKGLYNNAHGKSFPAKSLNVKTISNVVFKNRKVSSKIELHILQATEFDGKVYVEIELIKLRHYTDAYFVELDQLGNVLRWCKTGLIH